MSELSKEARQALWRCYRFLLSLPAEQDSKKENEDADKLAGTAASSDQESTEEVESTYSVAPSSAMSTKKELHDDNV